jgi:hypothetical protein
MASPATDHLEFEHLPNLTNIRISKVITTPKGLKYRAVAVKKNYLTLVPEAHGGITVVMTGTGVAELSIGGILDAIADAIGALVKVFKKLADCSPQTTVQQEFNKDGELVSQTITTTCVPN